MTLNYIIRIEKNGRETRRHFVAHLAEILTVSQWIIAFGKRIYNQLWNDLCFQCLSWRKGWKTCSNNFLKLNIKTIAFSCFMNLITLFFKKWRKLSKFDIAYSLNNFFFLQKSKIFIFIVIFPNPVFWAPTCVISKHTSPLSSSFAMSSQVPWRIPQIIRSCLYLLISLLDVPLLLHLLCCS